MKTNTFNIADHLETEDGIRGFLKEVVTTGSTEDFIHALNIAAKAKGISEVAKKAGVTRASLYKSLSEDGNPRFETINKIIHSLGCKLAVV
ncbi:MAG: putative addiction module antidote protein [Methyloprofundus sp.]|nr:putative addiction module antidote protein [Methyloprofundus sp.]